MHRSPVYLFTDFGLADPYVGQVHARLLAESPGVPVVDLHHYAPPFRPDLAARLLEALLDHLPPGGIVVGVVDPGVGTERGELAVEAGKRWFVGPDNGLFAAPLTDPQARAYRLALPQTAGVSVSFHGRDRFAPAAAALARGDDSVLGEEVGRPILGERVREEVIYSDHYGNLITGIPGEDVPLAGNLVIGGREVGAGRTFGAVPPGELFWYVNSLGLVEVAAREASAAAELGLGVGAPVCWTA